MVTWIPSIYPSHVSIYTSTMDPMDQNGPLDSKGLHPKSQVLIFPLIQSMGHSSSSLSSHQASPVFCVFPGRYESVMNQL